MYAMLEVRNWFPRCRLTVTDRQGEVVWTETFLTVRRARKAVERIALLLTALEVSRG